MRPIKFRIWDKEQEQWYQPIFKAYELKIYELMLTPSGEVVMRTMNELKHESLFPGRYEIMQYTGLTDRNGKEIYEGDVLLYPDWETHHVIKWHNRDCGWYMAYVKSLDDESSEDHIIMQCSTDSEVIGNIYEHPHLIES